MVRKELTPPEIYKLLPKTNCGECGVPTCMAFAFKVARGKASPVECPYLSEEASAKLLEETAPPIAKIVISSRGKKVEIGGERVSFRHEDKFFNETALALELNDKMSENKIKHLLERVKKFKVERMGQTLRLNLLALKSCTGNPEIFRETVMKVRENTDLPLILCSFNPQVMMRGLEEIQGEKPLIFSADKRNLLQMSTLARRFKCPIAVHSEDSMSTMIQIIKRLKGMGIRDIVLSPPVRHLKEAVSNLTIIRRTAIDKGFNILGYPTITFSSAFNGIGGKEIWETILASTFILRYASIVIFKNLEEHNVLPILALRQAIYTDPRAPLQVKPGLYAIGNPGEESPVLLTTNYSLTYQLVSEDIKNAGLNCYLLVVNTDGLSVVCSVAGDKLKPERIAETIKETSLEEKVNHRKLVIPGRAARLRVKIEDETGWEVEIGPLDSREIKGFFKR